MLPGVLVRREANPVNPYLASANRVNQLVPDMDEMK